jgi:lipid-binding SYLF domain-containing protein
VWLALGTWLLGVGCMSPKGTTDDEKRSYVRQMAKETLDELYAKKPDARARIESAPGYAVLSNIESKIIFVGGGGGYGIAREKATGNETFLRLAKGQAGFGLGVQSVRVVLVFRKKETLSSFLTSGWDFGGGAEAVAKADDQGGAVSAQGSIDADPIIYQLTQTGLSASATVEGVKVWKDKDLN